MSGPESKTVGAAALHAMLGDGEEIAVLDVREEGVFSRGHILLAASVPLSNLEWRVPALLPRRDVRVVLVDDSDGLAIKAATRLRSAGFSNVAILAGGNASWAAAGFRLFSGVNVPSKVFGEIVEHRYGTPSVDAVTLAAWQREKRDIVILDSRPWEEYRARSIPGGIDCPGAELVARATGQVRSAQTTIVVNCAGRTRSIIGAQSLRSAGLDNPVVALRNGTMGWHLAGLEVAAGADRAAERAPPEEIAVARRRARKLSDAAGIRYVEDSEIASMQADRSRTTYVFDVRLPADFASGHRADALNAPGGQLVQATDVYMPVRHAAVVLCDRDDVQAPMTAWWLQQMGWDVSIARNGVESTASEAMSSTTALPPVRAVSSVSVEDLVRAPASFTLLDVGDSRAFRLGRLPGSSFAIRSRLEHCLQRLGPHRRLVFVCSDGVRSQYAAADAATLGHAEATFLEGGRAAWVSAGGQLESSAVEHFLTATDDVWYRPYDPGMDVEAAMRGYLEWEVDLVKSIQDEPGLAFRLAIEHPLGASPMGRAD